MSHVPVSLCCTSHALNVLKNTHSVESKVHQNKAQKSDGDAEFWDHLQRPADGTNMLVSDVSFVC